MISVDELLSGKRYRDVDVVTVTPTSLSARVDGKLVEINLEAKPELNSDIQHVCVPGTKTLRIAQADLSSVRYKELDPNRTEAWLVVADPMLDPPTMQSFTATKAAAALSVLIPDRTKYVSGLTDAEILAYPTVCSIITRAVSDGGQSSSRNGAVVKYLQEHHSTMTSNDAYIRMVQNGDREVSSSFGVQDDDIARIVNLTRRPWTSGSATYDAMAFTVETANSTLAPNYYVSEKSKDSLGRIAAAMEADGALVALTTVYIYLHKQMKSRFGVSYGTECPIHITPEDTIARAKKIPLTPQVVSRKDNTMTVMRVTDWASRHYLVNDLGHSYIPDPAEVPGLLSFAGQEQAKDILFGHFLPALARVNANLETSVLGILIKSLQPPTAKTLFRATLDEDQELAKPLWLDAEIWEESKARGLVHQVV